MKGGGGEKCSHERQGGEFTLEKAIHVSMEETWNGQGGLLVALLGETVRKEKKGGTRGGASIRHQREGKGKRTKAIIVMGGRGGVRALLLLYE